MDYFKILNLQREPFSNSPEPEFFFQSDQHQSCLQKLELAVRLRRGLNIVMGEVGTGKTTLCRQLILDLSRNEEDKKYIETHLILDPSFSNAPEFLSAVATFLGVAAGEGTTEWQLKEQIKKYLFARGIEEGRTVVLIIDEGQKLPDYCLEILREFLNYETNEYKLLQIVIFAQKEFEQALRQRPNFADRVNQYYLLKPLNFLNSIKLIKFRLAHASSDADAPRLFTWPGLWAIYRGSGGYPRKIITLCHQALLALIIQNRPRAGYFLVRSCAARVTPEQAARWPRWALGLVVAGLIIAYLMMNYGARLDFALSRGPVAIARQATPRPKAEVKGKNATEQVVKISLVPPQEALLSLPVKKAPLAAHSKIKPTLLGQVAVRHNGCVLRIMEKVYGNGALSLLDAVARANPQIKNVDIVKKGDVINIPARQKPPALPSGKCWVRIAVLEDLGAAYEFIMAWPLKPPPLLFPCWNKQDGLTFPLLLGNGFDDETTAQAVINSLPTPYASQARVVKEWDDGVMFL